MKVNFSQVSVDVVEVVLNKPIVGKAFKKEAKVVTEHVSKLNDEQTTQLENDINSNG